MTNPLGGFPTHLRDYLPTTSPSPSRPRPEQKRSASTDRSKQDLQRLRSASPSQARALKSHSIRQHNGRLLRSHDLHEMRVSGARRDKSPDAWGESSFNHRSPRMAMPKAARCSIAGMELPTRCTEQTAEVAPTLCLSRGPFEHEMNRCRTTA